MRKARFSRLQRKWRRLQVSALSEENLKCNFSKKKCFKVVLSCLPYVFVTSNVRKEALVEENDNEVPGIIVLLGRTRS